ncbi:hypothetical protein BU26DRAFT_335669 [Trematosphaeria pertusa]|uniref:Uncharacterized protein n=1 Tax=Trematosphaeria pertusa TaxID=390896 RepID=A0A6A6ID18_9PLEO|nr:uncharacterized protein BU26DRAFT_335669 [Trematosphaeria pertusa]KAF2248475.1 hypothetical protein BU26DRAFT_335669 [Trematosphaeria pertusa]
MTAVPPKYHGSLGLQATTPEHARQIYQHWTLEQQDHRFTFPLCHGRCQCHAMSLSPRDSIASKPRTWFTAVRGHNHVSANANWQSSRRMTSSTNPWNVSPLPSRTMYSNVTALAHCFCFTSTYHAAALC